MIKLISCILCCVTLFVFCSEDDVILNYESRMGLKFPEEMIRDKMQINKKHKLYKSQSVTKVGCEGTKFLLEQIQANMCTNQDDVDNCWTHEGNFYFYLTTDSISGISNYLSAWIQVTEDGGELVIREIEI